MSSNAETLTREASGTGIRADGIGHAVVNVTNLDDAKDFYCGILGFSSEPDITLPECGDHAVVGTAAGEYIALSQIDSWSPLPETGIHNAYRVTEQAKAAILDRLDREGVQVHTYREAREAEASDNCYFDDPTGNRIQLVASSAPPDGGTAAAVQAIDHVAVQAIDVEWEEEFYLSRLGLEMDSIIGLRTADYVLARRWKNGEVDMAPGAMRLDKRYSVIHGTDPVPRPNIQLFVKAGSGVLGIYLANKHFQLPPEEAAIGTPRLAFRVVQDALAVISEACQAMRCPVSGPVEHPPHSPFRYSLYCQDPGANFIEFYC